MAYLSRFIRISWALWVYLFWLGLVRLHWLHPKLSPARKFAGMLAGLGTTFIKLGQGLSLRRDLLPDDYIEALQALQDSVAPFDGKTAVLEIEQSLGAPVHELFAEFDEQALAAASIAQVHRARLHDGRDVVVKVRRPAIKAQVARDMRLLKLAVRLLAALVPRLRQFQSLAIIEETDNGLQQEMDFRREARNVKRFVQMFEGSKTIYVPPIVDDLYTDAVMVQIRSGGRRIDDPAVKARGAALAQALVDAYLRQYFLFGMFHGDPHPGNLFVMEDGRLCLHDFGLVGFLDHKSRKALAAAMQAFVQRDSGWLLDAYQELGLIAGDLDRAEFIRGLEEMLEDYAALPMKDWSFSEAFIAMMRLGQGRNVRVPHNLLVYLRASLLTESAVRTLDAEFNVVQGLTAGEQQIRDTIASQASKAMQTRLKYEAAEAIQELPQALAEGIRRLRREGFQWRLYHRGLEDLESHLDRSSNRLALALVALGLYIASSLLMQSELGPRVAGIPLPALIGYVLAFWFTIRLVRGISRSGRL
ncbi:hypothetical protein Tel_11715 [Candidatus Tenderia electrophaga]|uniref:ABC1 atypical kinase-like domain-containing protein n=1 Tax=Candidatus Tenderia electrophaga TaxID=1748243 RepID=A0A0S2TF38_9GAMM|nr:hypothetical protein Tel_11715 [Candidatus Tenderia electrophaga]